MFQSVCERLDAWIVEENRRRFDEGGARLRLCSIKLFGQAALLERSDEFSFPIAATKDVDVFANFDYAVEKKFAELVKHSGWVLDPLGHEAWMPEETKNRPLLTEFIAEGASERFLQLATKYKLNLERLLQ